MEIKDFVILAMSIKKPILIVKTDNSYHVEIETKDDNAVVLCTTQRKKTREWAGLGRLIKALEDRNFVGEVRMIMHRQKSLF